MDIDKKLELMRCFFSPELWLPLRMGGGEDGGLGDEFVCEPVDDDEDV